MKLTAAQRRVWEHMRNTGDTVMVWPPDGFSPGHHQFGEKWGSYRGQYDSWPPPKVSIATIQSMIKKGCFIVVDRTNANATSTGRNAAARYKLRADVTPL